MPLENVGLRAVEAASLGGLLLGGTSVLGESAPNVVQLPAHKYNWTDPRQHDLVVRPTWIHWVCPVTSGSADVLARQSTKQRQRCRPAMRALARMQVSISQPIDPELYDEWIPLYSAQVGQMRHGRDLARFYRRSVLAPDSQHGLIAWRQDGRLVCGVVFHLDLERSALAGRFGAVAPEAKQAELPRGMYMKLADLAAERGLRYVTLGSDVNFYGAFADAGLCGYKLRLGFCPVPADLFGRTGSKDVVERMVTLEGLEPPVVRFEYQRPRSPQATPLDFLEGPDMLGLVSVCPPGLQSRVLDALPAHRRLILSA